MARTNTATEIDATSDNQSAVLYDDNHVSFRTLAGVVTGSDITLDTTSTLVGFASVVPEPATLGLFAVFGSVLFLFRRRMSE